MSQLLITNAAVHTPTKEIPQGWLLVEDKKIKAVSHGALPETSPGCTIIDAEGQNLLPGLIDLHVHGGMGLEVMDADPVKLRGLASFYASHGVTGFLATTWTAEPEAIHRALRAVADLAGLMTGGATILGAHLEGPFFNPVRAGAQDATLIRAATPEEVLPYFEYGVVKLVALAPEIPGNLWLVDECARRGIIASAGHTDATYEQMAEAIAHGLRQVTHCYNAMSLLQHRFPGVLGAAMLFPEIKAELIADNIHVHPASMKLLYQAKGPEGVILITDAVRGAGMPDGEYPIDRRTIIVKNGSARLPDGSLAGSVLTLERGLMNFQAATGQPLQEVWGCSSRNAAQASGFGHRKGLLSPGYDADLVLLDGSFSVGMTVVEGQIVYRSSTF